MHAQRRGDPRNLFTQPLSYNVAIIPFGWYQSSTPSPLPIGAIRMRRPVAISTCRSEYSADGDNPEHGTVSMEALGVCVQSCMLPERTHSSQTRNWKKLYNQNIMFTTSPKRTVVRASQDAHTCEMMCIANGLHYVRELARIIAGNWSRAGR